MDDVTIIFAIVVLAINFVLYLPIGVYFTRRFWIFRQQTMISKRRPLLVVMTVILIYFWMLISRTIDIFEDILKLIPRTHGTRVAVHTFVDTGWICVALYAIRMWLLFYDYKRAEHLSQMRWRTKIDSTTVPWTIQYKSLSNLVYLISFAIIHWLIIEFISLLSISLSDPKLLSHNLHMFDSQGLGVISWAYFSSIFPRSITSYQQSFQWPS